MNYELYDKAEQLANRNYDIVIEADTLADGSTIYVARNPELAGCKAQGKTLEAAARNLKAARVDYIYALLADGQAVPDTRANTLNVVVRI